MIPFLVPLLGTILDKIFPNAEDAAKAKLELLKLEQEGAFRQLEINKTEASNSSIFVAGARPFIMWVCGIIFAYTYLIQPFLIFILAVFNHPVLNLPRLDTSEVMSLLLGMLGLGGMRTFEKIKGVATGVIGDTAENNARVFQGQKDNRK